MTCDHCRQPIRWWQVFNTVRIFKAPDWRSVRLHHACYWRNVT
jgi:hypothetical protein